MGAPCESTGQQRLPQVRKVSPREAEVKVGCEETANKSRGQSRPRRRKVKGQVGDTHHNGKMSSEQKQDKEQEREERSVFSRRCSAASSAVAAASVFQR